MYQIAQLLADTSDSSATAAVATAGIGFTLLIGFFIFIVSIISLLGTVFWIWMLIDAVKREFDEPNTKVLWIVLLIVLQFVGAVVYYFVVRRPAKLAHPAVSAPAAPAAPPAPPAKKRKIAKK